MMLEQWPVVKAEMLIRKPAEVVYEAFVDPAVTTNFWFTKSSGRLEQGKRIRWDWDMFGVWDELQVDDIVPNRRIRVTWSDGSTTAWTFAPRGADETFVTIVSEGYPGNGDEVVARAIDDMGGYTMVLCALKAWLEHNIDLNVVSDKAPDAVVSRE